MVGTIITAPIRVDYEDYSKAYDSLTGAGIKIVYKTVSSVAPYHATIHLEEADEAEAKKILAREGIKYHPVVPFY